MHLRWQSPKSYIATPPFTSRASPGLHAFFTPLGDTSDDAFCLALHELVSSELKCSTTSQSATKVPVLSERFAMSASLQFYGHLGEIEGMKEDLQRVLCRGKEKGYCVDMVGEIVTARYVDVDYDTISQAVVVTAGWPHAHEEGRGWTDEIRLPSKDATVGIGVLNLEGNTDPEDIQFGGFLTVLGEDEKPSTFLTCHQPTIYTKNPANSSNRTHTLPNPNPPLSPRRPLQKPHCQTISPPPNLHHQPQPTHRSPPNPNPHLPRPKPHHPSPRLQTPHLPNPPLLPLHRPIPIQRLPLPRLQAPQAPALPIRRHRPRSPRLVRFPLGLSRLIRTHSAQT